MSLLCGRDRLCERKKCQKKGVDKAISVVQAGELVLEVMAQFMCTSKMVPVPSIGILCVLCALADYEIGKDGVCIPTTHLYVDCCSIPIVLTRLSAQSGHAGVKELLC